LARPTLAPCAVLSDCIGGCSDPVLVGRLKSIETTLVATASLYDDLAKTQSLHLLPRQTPVGNVSNKELQDLYTDQMSAAKGAGRSYYNALRNSVPNGICPLCGVGNVAVLDHHLPKARYPDLAVCPFNLVPACDFCNNAKKARFPTSAGEQTIHPYYDDFTNDQWIFAHLDSAGPPALVFHVSPPSNWPLVSRQIAKRHFDVVKLGISFTSNANHDMITLKRHLAECASTKGPEGVWAHLDGERSRYRARLNSWQHVMYQTLATNSWFISGGYLNIPG
jgi:5-methylcytosine-specific restriction endonuclease McrA